MTRHAPPPEIDLLLLGYAAGTLGEALSLLAASYISVSEEARRRVYECEAVGGALLCHECAPEPMRAGSLDDVLRRLDAPEAARPQERPQPRRPEALAACELPLPLLEFICGCPQTVLRWRRVTNGWEILAVPTACPQTQVTLVRAVPGARAPARAGRGGMRLVLQGGWVEQAQRHPAGTLLVYGEEPCEDAAACRSDGCLCLVVDEGAPAPGGWGALFRRFFS